MGHTHYDLVVETELSAEKLDEVMEKLVGVLGRTLAKDGPHMVRLTRTAVVASITMLPPKSEDPWAAGPG